METLERSCGGGRDVFAQSTHGKDQIDAGNVTEVEQAAIGRAVGATIFGFQRLQVNGRGRQGGGKFLFIGGVCAKRSLDCLQLVRVTPVGAAELKDGLCLINTDAVGTNSDSHVEKMEDATNGGGQLEVSSEVGTEGLKLGHSRE